MVMLCLKTGTPWQCRSEFASTCRYSWNLKKRFPFRVPDPFEVAFWVDFAFPLSVKRNSHDPEFALAKKS